MKTSPSANVKGERKSIVGFFVFLKRKLAAIGTSLKILLRKITIVISGEWCVYYWIVM